MELVQLGIGAINWTSRALFFFKCVVLSPFFFIPRVAGCEPDFFFIPCLIAVAKAAVERRQRQAGGEGGVVPCPL